MKKNGEKMLVLLLVIYLTTALVFPQEDFRVDMPKKSYGVGENITVDFEISNPGSERKIFTCVLVFDPPTSKNPMCRTVEVVLEPGEIYYGSIGEIAEIAGESEAEIKLLDSDDNILEEMKLPVMVTHPDELVCGDGRCTDDETYETCPEDCQKPEIETTTTMEGLTTLQTKSKGEGGFEVYLPYIIGLLILIIIVFIIYKKIETKKIEKERKEFEKWKEEKKCN